MKTLKLLIKQHKLATIIGSAVMVVVIAGGTAFGINAQKVANSQKALELAAENGGITAEQLQELEENGGFADFGTEMVDPTTGETVILTKNDDGTITRTVVKDANGNETNNKVPEAGHVHSFIPHYTTGTRTVTKPITHPAVTEKVEVSPAGFYCNHIGCDKYLPNPDVMLQHAHETGHGNYYSRVAIYEDRVVTPAWTEYVESTETYSYIDYYYCDCGIHQ